MTHLLKADPEVRLDSSLGLIPYIQSFSNYSHFNVQNVSGLCPPLSTHTVWSKLPSSLWKHSNNLWLDSHSLLFSNKSTNLVVTDPQETQSDHQGFTLVILSNSHNSVEHPVFGQYEFLDLPCSDPTSDEAFFFSMFRSWSHRSSSTSFLCSGILSAVYAGGVGWGRVLD